MEYLLFLFLPVVQSLSHLRLFVTPWMVACHAPLSSTISSSLLKFMSTEMVKLPDVQAGFRKVRGTRGQIANICWIIEQAGEFQKNIYFCFIDYVKAFVWITINCGKF